MRRRRRNRGDRRKGKKSRRKAGERAAKKDIAKARTQDSLQALSKLTEVVDGRTASSAIHRWWSRCASCAGTYGLLARRDRG